MEKSFELSSLELFLLLWADQTVDGDEKGGDFIPLPQDYVRRVHGCHKALVRLGELCLVDTEISDPDHAMNLRVRTRGHELICRLRKVRLPKLLSIDRYGCVELEEQKVVKLERVK
jgi:hypothetical protein